MRASTQLTQSDLVTTPTPSEVKVLDFLRRWVTEIRSILNGLIGFGDGVNSDNIKGVWVTYTSNAAADTEDTLTHNLGFVPVGYLVMKQNKAASFYDSGTPWTTSQMFLKCDGTSVTASVFVLAPSNVNI